MADLDTSSVCYIFKSLLYITFTLLYYYYYKLYSVILILNIITEYIIQSILPPLYWYFQHNLVTFVIFGFLFVCGGRGGVMLKTNLYFIFGKLEEDKGSIEQVYYCHTLGRSLQDYCRRVAGMFG